MSRIYRDEKTGKCIGDATIKGNVSQSQAIALNPVGKGITVGLLLFSLATCVYFLKVYEFIRVLFFVVVVVIFAPNNISARFSEISAIKTIDSRCLNCIAKY